MTRPPSTAPGGITVSALTDVLVRSLRALGDAGRPVQASRLAARAWWLLRDDWSRHAEHVNGAMHYLARLPPEAEDAPPRGAAGEGSESSEGPESSESSDERRDLT